ncbi:sulfite exporter TauE/SafE family protein [Corynebacterium mendelii]|uniref:Probable membrane transporter protein n=1 Tax=Corynebacterium mendelii TaxID=2765362 RepID=A0A939IXU6_9CORY|nr:sulfite exporter TauE/SafE family protein [Corynebacterium mendelii]MBN9644017.1 sulfite exporter TauE/SafE family protein [Corynebacterium mendelii]
MITFVEAALVGIVVGLVIGALGAGGGIIAVPVLTYLLGQTPHDATNGSLVIVAVTALLTLPGKAKMKQIRWKDGLVFGAMSSIGAIAGRMINQQIDGKMLLILFSVLLLGVSGLMMRNALKQRRDEDRRMELYGGYEATAAGASGTSAVKTAAAKAVPKDPDTEPRPLPYVAAAATATGLLTGLFGVGGGFAVVPVLILVMRFTVREATGTSLVVMIIAAVVSILTGVTVGSFHVDWPVVLLFVAGSSLAGHVGGRLSQRARQSTLAIIFACMVLLVGLSTFISTVLGIGV